MITASENQTNIWQKKFRIRYKFNLKKFIEIVENITLGIIILTFGLIIVYVGHYLSKKIRVFHVVVYFMAIFVLMTGVLLLVAYDKPPIFFG